MEGNPLFTIPKQLQYQQILPSRKEYELNEPHIFQIEPPFAHEIAFYKNQETFKPWELNNVNTCAQMIMTEWKELKKEIQQHITDQNKEMMCMKMLKGVEYFLECLYWINEKPVNLEKGLVDKQLTIKPFNVEERISFILKRMNGYHSFKQLEELFKELEKQFAIIMIKRKKNKE
jgi:hypothetical protein